MSYLNAEHYFDPTAGDAIRDTEGGKLEPLLVIGEDGFPEDASGLELYVEDPRVGYGEDVRREGLRTHVGPRDRHWNITNWEDFANGIIIQAAGEYRAARRILRDWPGDPEALATIREVEEFMLSPWFSHLTTLKGGKLLRMLREEIIQ